MAKLEDYSSGAVLEGVKEKERMLEKIDGPEGSEVREELERREKGAEKRHFIVGLDVLEGLVEKSSVVAVGPRVCLEIHEDCRRPERAVFLDELAEALIERGKAERTTEKEVMEVLREGKRKGHSHVVSIVSGKPMELCNTCSHCCILWKLEEEGIKCISKESPSFIQV
ncbi:hypothetical protein AKJ63_00850 [candidate division MSBL1 archaeon SCGC-AAA259D18]|uniref:Uncharacterized protein n=1 Tax=candidate division MSBL1 archaeon SCGC-AAA259D18 TaxID=1698262 RepID=A0A133UCE0_9EURY|nr:hypothetical protein AKJ63_00850 [candidate division MSBL1 archaeon SCGC-AAA259D18]